MSESNQRFDVLRADAIADWQETAQKFNAAIPLEGFAIAQMDTDRHHSDERYQTAITQMNTDRQRSDERYQTQLEVIQSLRACRTNRDVGEVEAVVGRLDDRVDSLAQAS
jgi:hypothetical protein